MARGNLLCLAGGTSAEEHPMSRGNTVRKAARQERLQSRADPDRIDAFVQIRAIAIELELVL
jgi:hypothetical protein